MRTLKIRDPATKEWREIPALVGDDGDSAYEIAVVKGFVGTEQQWLDSLQASVESISNLELEELLK